METILQFIRLHPMVSALMLFCAWSVSCSVFFLFGAIWAVRSPDHTEDMPANHINATSEFEGFM